MKKRVTVPEFNTLFPLLCVLYICVWSIFPAIQLGNVFRLTALACAVLWFFIINSRRNYVMDRQDVLMAFFVVLVVVVSILATMGFSGILPQVAVFMMFFGYYMAKYYEKSDIDLSFISVVVITLLVVSNFRTFSALATDEHLTRAMVRNDEETYQYIRQGIGGYGLIYPQVCIAPLITSWTISSFKKNKLCFALGVVWIISFVLLVLNGGYTIAIVVGAIGFVLVLAKSKKSIIYSLVISLGVMLTIYLLIAHSSNFRNFLLETFQRSNAIKSKINDLYNTYWGLGDADSVEVRSDAYLFSLKGIITYPILGGLWNPMIGSHSAILDTISQYGWFGGYAFITMIFHVPVNQKRKSKDGYIKKVVNSVMTTTFIIALLDTFPYQMMMAVTVISLALFKDIIKWREKT